MIDSIGIDIVENARINDKNFNSFVEEILTENEKQKISLKKGKKQLEYLCGRFAGKEAIIKAISNHENPHMKEIEILNDNDGRPYVKFKNYKILISISHERNYTIAEAILLKNKEN